MVQVLNIHVLLYETNQKMYKGSRTLWIQNCSNSYESTTNRQLKPIQLVTYLLNTAFTETLTGIVAISVPPSAMLGSIT